MPSRPPRLAVKDGLYHVWARAVRGGALFQSNDDYELFVRVLAYVVRKDGIVCHQYCLIPNHYHLLIETPAANISRAMHRLNSTFAQAFNADHSYQGHVFQARFGAKLVESDAYFVTVVRYIARNPITAGLCADAAEWRWSDHRFYVGHARPPDFLTTRRVLRLFSPDPDRARDQYDAFVHNRLLVA